MPSVSFNGESIQIPSNLRLADPDFNISSKIDILLGASAFWRALCAGQIDLGFNKPVLQKTKFGWILSGICRLEPFEKSRSIQTYLCTEEHSLEKQLSRFWDLEQLQSAQCTPKFTQQELLVENHFLKTTTRNSEGRFIVSVLFKETLSEPFVLTADVEKMFRQVLTHPDHCKYHRILWNDNSGKQLVCFELNTVTYGTASASYLSTRCLRALADEHQHLFPRSCNIIRNNFYIDDLLVGAESINSLKSIKNEVTAILNTGGFNLRKFMSNEPSLSDELISSEPYNLKLENHYESKTLGVNWNHSTDILGYSIKRFEDKTAISKRTILSTTAQVFDPLGLLAPIIVNAKLLLQVLWQHKLSWDESLPLNLHTAWITFRNELKLLNSLKIPRCIIINDPIIVELHGFADASTKAYGASVYIRSIDSSNQIKCDLLCAKSRVAPLKPVTLPKLELCAALLLSQLISKVSQSLDISFSSVSYYTDSSITLAWINADPQKWRVFVSNRVAEIQTLSQPSNWHHVRTAENPAD